MRPRFTPPQLLRRALEELGGSFVKLGQMLALQPDVLPMEYCRELFELLDRVPPAPWNEVREVLRAELGRDPEEVFDSLDTEPIASASIGQVHRGSVGGAQVAIKIQRPAAEAAFRGDLALMAVALRLLRRFPTRSLAWMVEPLSEFVEWTRDELDYRGEAEWMARLGVVAEGRPAERVPRPFRKLTTRRVLVAEYLDGATLMDLLRARRQGGEAAVERRVGRAHDPAAFAGNVIDNFLADAFEHGFFHADLHPANLLVMPGGVVGYVDFGIIGVLSKSVRRNLVALTLAYTRGDVEAMSHAFLAVSEVGPGGDPTALRRGLERMSAGWYTCRHGRRGLAKTFTRVMLEMLRLSREVKVFPAREVVRYIRSAIAIDGLIARFAPQFDLAAHLESLCARHLTQEAMLRRLEPGALMASAGAMADLVFDGPRRSARLLDRLEAGEVRVRPQAPRRPRLRLGEAAVAALGLALPFAAMAAFEARRGEALVVAGGVVTALAAALVLGMVRAPRPS